MPRRGGVPTLLVLGTGSLARSVCGALAAPPPGVPADELRLVLVGRTERRVAEARYLTATRAAVAGRPLTVRTATVGAHAGTGVDGAAVDELSALIASVRPDGVLVCASAQSPWEPRHAPSAWTTLLSAGFGLALPLQASLALRAGRALHAAGSPAWLVNACFPDAVNPLLAALGVPVLCGIGNVATLAASLAAGLPADDRRRLRLVAHHLHLHEPHNPDDEALAFLGDEPLTGVTDRLAAQRATPRTELNQVTGLDGAVLLAGLLSGREVCASLPGPLGLPGGYPVVLRDGRARLDLPAAITPAEAVARNRRWSVADGVWVTDERVEYAEPIRAALADVAPGLAAGFAVRRLAAAVTELSALRDRLRRQPCPPSPPLTEQP